MTDIRCNPGSLLVVEGARLTVAGDRVYVDGAPLDELLRAYYLAEFEYQTDTILQLGPARVTFEARPIFRGR